MKTYDLQLSGTSGVTNALLFISTYQKSEITPHHVFESPSNNFRKVNIIDKLFKTNVKILYNCLTNNFESFFITIQLY